MQHRLIERNSIYDIEGVFQKFHNKIKSYKIDITYIYNCVILYLLKLVEIINKSREYILRYHTVTTQM